MKGSTAAETVRKYGWDKLCNDHLLLVDLGHGDGLFVFCQQFKDHIANATRHKNKLHCWKALIHGQVVEVWWKPDPGRLTEKETRLMEQGVCPVCEENHDVDMLTGERVANRREEGAIIA